MGITIKNEWCCMGTSFHGTILNATLNELLACGFVDLGESGDGKCQHVFNVGFTPEFETEETNVSIYDWKMYGGFGDDEVISWHIGGINQEMTDKAKKEILNLIHEKARH